MSIKRKPSKITKQEKLKIKEEKKQNNLFESLRKNKNIRVDYYYNK